MISRRDLLKLSAAAAVSPVLPAVPQDSSPPDYTLEIAAVTLDLSPRHKLRTVAYNGQAPGPLLRLREGQPVTIEVANHTDHPEVVHWHGLLLPPAVDGSIEEGTPPIAPHARARYSFTPRPAGFRWYHTHASAMDDLTRGQYSAQHGLLMIEARDNPGQYDQEFFLALHDWEGHLSVSEDGAMNPSYAVSTINGKTLGSGEPLRVRQGERILLHVLNTSPTEVHWVALAGHELRAVALDGNPVPTPRSVPMLRLAPQSPILVPLVFESKFRGHGAIEGWTINGKSYPDTGSAPLIQGQRYRLQFINKSRDDHPLHLHRHNFELRSLGRSLDATARPAANRIRGIIKDVVLVDSRTLAEVDFIADQPGPTLFHCHQQSHMDFGFMMLFNYA
jgi:FtsP/CotA-like multicopper oxidase with cupredoxin domain